MSDQNVFNRRHVEQAAVDTPVGMLEQLNLPPGAIRFIRRNQRAIWIAAICIALAITAVSLFASYRDYREGKAASALTEALQADTDRREQLEQVAEEYGSTSSARWARIEIAQLAAEQDRLDEAAEMLTGVLDDVGLKNPLSPLLLYRIGGLQEKKGDLEQAAASFEKLTGYEEFAANAYAGLGRIYEQQGQKARAVEMYRKYLDLTGEAGGLQPGAAPDREIIESRIARLEG